MRKKQYISEEMIGLLGHNIYSTDDEVYKNPKSINRINNGNVRGISTAKGDIYVMSTKEGIHGDLAYWLTVNNIENFGLGRRLNNPIYKNKDVVLWSAKNGIFYFSDQYKIEDIVRIDKLVDVVKKKNPQLKFEFESILSVLSDNNNFSESIKEELLGQAILHWSDEKPEVYKNPKSIRRMSSDLRAISDKDGNLYVIDDALNSTHGDLGRWLVDKDFLDNKARDFYEYTNLNTIITWQRYNNSNIFKLGESYRVYKPKQVYDLINKLQKKHPQFIFDYHYINDQFSVTTLKGYKELVAMFEKENIKEELLGTFNGIELYKNPKSIRRMGKVRGISDEDGNLYVIDAYTNVHGNFGMTLARNKLAFENIPGDIYDYAEEYKCLLWDGEGDTFVFSDSSNAIFYDTAPPLNPNVDIKYRELTDIEKSRLKLIYDLVDKVQQRNPQFKFKTPEDRDKVLTETPDHVFVDGERIDFRYDDARAFGYYDGQMYVGETHNDWHYDIVPNTGYGKIMREEFEYGGRLWLDKKIISFWDYPRDNRTLMRIVRDINEVLRKHKEHGRIDVTWKVELTDNDGETRELIPIDEYKGKNSTGKSVKAPEHQKSPMLKKTKNVPTGIGSEKDFSKRKSGETVASYRARTTTESKLQRLIQKEIKQLLTEDYGGAGAATISKIKTTINNNWYAGVYYNGPKPGFRLIEPYVLGQGYVSSTGNVSHPERYYVRAYVILDTERDPFTKGKFKRDKGMRRTSASLSGKKLGWRLMRVDLMQNWQPIKKTINKGRPYYNPNDTMLRRIMAKI